MSFRLNLSWGSHIREISTLGHFKESEGFFISMESKEVYKRPSFSSVLSRVLLLVPSSCLIQAVIDSLTLSMKPKPQQ
jgi:hypothetical protein